MNLNLDLSNGILGAYHRQGNTTVDQEGWIGMHSVENGVRTLSGPVAGMASIATALGVLVISNGTRVDVAYKLASAGIAAILGTSVQEEMNKEDEEK